MEPQERSMIGIGKGWFEIMPSLILSRNLGLGEEGRRRQR